ncbi:AAA family ATPase [Streptomyces sp. NPDC047315]|uniref:HelD family protein n=1 Tax=Streptomyces sp. NPDC047315 TaxID=3155142 RepID=UPI00340D78C5
MTQPDDVLNRALERERAHHDACRAALRAMVDDAAQQVVIGEHAFASGADAEVLGRQLRSRAKEMREEPAGPLFFGRLDFTSDASAGEHRAQRYHVGRRRITGRTRPVAGPTAGSDPGALPPPLVIDWRAPVSRAFYQATARDPQGVAVRRRFGWAPFSEGESDDLTGFEDEHLHAAPTSKPMHTTDAPGAPGTPGAARAAGTTSAIVADEIERPRVGPMRDIAATIQPDQDDLVRSPLADSLCVQGAPGTGKTAVGLHRAAYLLYTHPQRVSRGGLLVLGPNRAFLSYIAQVLPALGESGVRQSTVEEEVARHEVRADDAPAAAAVKHDARMADVLRRALYARVAVPADAGADTDADADAPLTVPEGSYRWRVPAADLARIVAEVRAEAPPYAVGRERVRARVVRHLQIQAERRADPKSASWTQRIGRSRPVAAFLDAVWPKVTPEEVLAAFLADPVDPALTAAEQDAVRWHRPPRSYRTARWSRADLVLLDEIAGLVERPAGYGHIVVDEAQDLSPMQCRAVARRADFGSLTVLGDLAQGTTPWAARTWPEQLAHLGKADAAVVPLTTGFRVPAAVVELANGLLASLDVDVPAGRSLRADGELTVRRVDDLAAATVDAVRTALGREGSIGVIADGPTTPLLRAALTAAGIEAADLADASEGAALAARVTVLPAALAKGLEYDHVVVAEPAAIAAAEERGLHRLYVVLTRAVARLAVLHVQPLPPALTSPPLPASRAPLPSARPT